MSQSADQLRTSPALNCRRYASVADYILAAEPRFGRDGPDKTRTIYFIGTPDGPVKIGLTNNVRQRLESPQTGSPVKLEVLATREDSGHG